MKVRGGSREMDMMFKDAGASVLSLPSNEIYAAMQTGAMDAALTSSTSLISFRLEEVSKALTSGRGKSYWFMFEPLLMSKQVFDKLPKAQQDAIMAVGAELGEVRGRQREGRRRSRSPTSTRRPAPKVADLDDAALAQVAGARRARVEGLRRQERELRQAAGGWRRSCCERRRARQRHCIGAQRDPLADRPERETGAPTAPSTLRRACSSARCAGAQPRSCCSSACSRCVAASLVLTYSVFSRYLFKAATDWQDEVAVFCIVGARVPVRRVGAGACAATSASRRSSSVLPARGQSRSARRRRRRADARVLRVLRVEVVDAVPRGLGRQDDDVVDVRAAAQRFPTA